MKPSLHFSSATPEWATPQDFFDSCNREFGPFAIDVCATKANAKCQRFFSRRQNGLAQIWEGACWMNPPYGRGQSIAAWISKAIETARSGSVVVCLLPARTETRWWHDLVRHAAIIRFVKGRLQFNDCGVNAPFPSALVVFKPGTHPTIVQWGTP